MMKYDYPNNTKFKTNFDISILQSYSGLKAHIVIQEHYIQFKVIDYGKVVSETTKDKKFDILYNLLKPIYIEGEDTVLINYAIIKSVKLHENKIKVELYNPAYLTTINIILYNIESVGLIMNKTLNKDNLSKLQNFLTQKLQCESKLVIEQFLLFFNMLRSEVDPNVVKYLHEDRFYRALFESKKYYEKSISEIKKLDKIKLSVNKKILSDSKKGNDNSFEMASKSSANGFEYNIIQRTINENMLNMYTTFESMFNEIKIKSSKIIDETIIIFLHISALETDLINLKKINKVKVADQLKTINNREGATVTGGISCKSVNNDAVSIKSNKSGLRNRGLNKSANFGKVVGAEDIFAMLNKREEFDNLSSSTQTNSKKDKRETYQPETPKFCPGGMRKKEDPSSKDICITNLNEILKKIEEVKKNHALLQPNNHANIIHNTIEIVHRKYFEIAFEEFFPKTFNLEKDKTNNLIKLDSLYSFFLNLRGLKNYLFTDENKVHFSNVFFLD
jgi:hypothetical protein